MTPDAITAAAQADGAVGAVLIRDFEQGMEFSCVLCSPAELPTVLATGKQMGFTRFGMLSRAVTPVEFAPWLNEPDRCPGVLAVLGIEDVLTADGGEVLDEDFPDEGFQG